MEFEKKYINRTDLEEEQAAQAKKILSFHQEEEFLRLKSHCLWLKAGDRNTSYFHKQCRIRLSKNHIAEITTSDGILLKGQNQIKLTAESHYQLMFKEGKEGNEEASTEFLSHIPSLVNKDNNSALSKQFTKEEICNIIWAMEPDKYPGTDGFSTHFYHQCWDTIKVDFVRMEKSFQQKANMGRSTNSTFLALIPKEVNTSTFERFRPISLYNSSYNILVKLLVNRIRPLLGNLISTSQGGFIKGRQILDNVI